MGIRITKCIGYGVLDAVAAGIDQGLLDEGDRGLAGMTPVQFWAWAMQNADKIVTSLPHNWSDPTHECEFNHSFSKGLQEGSPRRTCDHICQQGHGDEEEAEFGDSGVANWLLLTPPNHPDWSRTDDIIDWLDAQYPKGGHCSNLGSRASYLPTTGIFPYDGSMGRVRPPTAEAVAATGKAGVYLGLCKATRYDGEHQPTLMTSQNYNMLTGAWDRKREPLAEGAWLKHLKDDWNPTIPFPILAVAVRMGMADAQLAHIRPMRVTYWR